MKLDTKSFRYLSPQDWRVLTAVETGTRNHEVVPTPLITSLSHLHTGSNGVARSISTLAKLGLIARVKNARYDGYRLTYGGLDYLALHAHTKSSAIVGLGSRVGVGKESDVYLVTTPASVVLPGGLRNGSISVAKDSGEEGQQKLEQAILKLHRLGRTSFRTASTKRSYTKGRAHCTWQYLSRISAQKEFAAMTALRDAGFRVPQPIGWNRHAVVMGLVPGTPLKDVPLSSFGEIDLEDEPDVSEEEKTRRRSVRDERVGILYGMLMDILLELASHGVIHGDFNEFNILIQEPSSPTAPHTPWIIDFPQITSMSHSRARYFFDRDVDCVRAFFRKRYHFEPTEERAGPTFEEALARWRKTLGKTSNGERGTSMDVLIGAAGFTRKMDSELEDYYHHEAGDVSRVTTDSEEEDLEASDGEERSGDTIGDDANDFMPLSEGIDEVGSEVAPSVDLSRREAEADDSKEETSLPALTPVQTRGSPLTAEALAAQDSAHNLNGVSHKLQAMSLGDRRKRQQQPTAKAAAGWAL